MAQRGERGQLPIWWHVAGKLLRRSLELNSEQDQVLAVRKGINSQIVHLLSHPELLSSPLSV